MVPRGLIEVCLGSLKTSNENCGFEWRMESFNKNFKI